MVAPDSVFFPFLARFCRTPLRLASSIDSLDLGSVVSDAKASGSDPTIDVYI